MTFPRPLLVLLALATLAVFAAFASPGKAPDRRYLEPRLSSDPAALPFSGAVLVGDTLYLSGDIGLEPGNKVPKEAATEARLLMESFEKRLAAAGMTPDDLVYVTVYSTDVSDYASVVAGLIYSAVFVAILVPLWFKYAKPVVPGSGT